MKKISIAFVIIIIITGCKKYPNDDVKIHFRTVKKRLTTMLWVRSYHPNAEDYMQFDKDGKFDGGFNNPPLNFTGTWDLTDHKDNLQITNSSNNVTYNFKIERLECHYFLGPYNGSGDLVLSNDTMTLHYVHRRD